MNKKFILCLIIVFLVLPICLFASQAYEIYDENTLGQAISSLNNGADNQTVVWNITKDFSMSKKFSAKKKGMNITINGNNHTITAEQNGTLLDYALEFVSMRSNPINVLINDLNFVIKDGFRMGLQFQRDIDKGQLPLDAELNNVNIKMAHSTMPRKDSKDKYCAAIVVNDANLTLKGNCTIENDEYCWASIDVDNGIGEASLKFVSDSNIHFFDSRSDEKKNTESLIKFNKTTSTDIHSLTFTNENISLADKLELTSTTDFFGYNFKSDIHVHGSWTYKGEGNKIIATCGNSGCNLPNSQAFITISAPGTAQLSASVGPENATNKNVKWRSTSPEHALVDQNGFVTAVSAGETTIWAESVDSSDSKASLKIKVQSDN